MLVARISHTFFAATKKFEICGIAILLLAAAPIARTADLYVTDFDGFPTGPDQWVGTDGWAGNNVGAEVHGIDDGIVSGLAKTGYIGYNQPPSALTTVVRPVNYDPVSSNTPFIQFESLLGIQDSYNGIGDRFFITIYNRTGDFLGAVEFDNTAFSRGVWRHDGNVRYDTGLDFFPGELHLLFFEVDFSNNTWTADLDGIPLFTNATFNSTGKPLDLYGVAAEWQLASGSTNFYGDNWMLVADWSVRAIPDGRQPLVISDLHAGDSGESVISWWGEPGFTYELMATESLLSWTNAVTVAAYSNLLSETMLHCTNDPPESVVQRYYRVRRTATP